MRSSPDLRARTRARAALSAGSRGGRAVVVTAVASALVGGALVVVPATGASAARTRTSGTEARRVDSVPSPRLAWRGCGIWFSPDARCATADLPLDYDDPDGPTTTVAVLRIPAARPAQRIGTLFVNPGGPGGSGVELADAAELFLDRRILDRFDIVGFDPRGTGYSDGVRCWSDGRSRDAALAGLRPAFPAGTRQHRAAAASAVAFGRACAGRGGALARSMSTAEVARDLDVLRRAVGDERLTYLGFSYGSYLGEVYANLFPDRVRAIALDGVLDPVAWAGTSSTRGIPQTSRVGSDRGSAAALREVLNRCREAGPRYCSLAAHGDPVALHQRVLDAVKRRPLVIPDPVYPQTWTYADTVATLVDLLYSPWAGDDVDAFLTYLARLVTGPAPTRARRREAAAGLHRIALARRAARAVGGTTRRARAAFGTGPYYANAAEAFQTVMCTDARNPSRTEDWRRRALRTGRRTGGFGRLWTWSSAPCASDSWTVRDDDVYRGPFTARTANPVLVVAARWDPATPYAGAVAASRLLAGSRLLTSESFGHTGYGTSRCVDRAVTGYLLAGRLPAPGTRCVGDVRPFTVPLDADPELVGGLSAQRGPITRPASTRTRPRPPVVALRP